MIYVAECGRRYRWPGRVSCGICGRALRCAETLDVDGMTLYAGRRCAARFREFVG